MNIKNNLNLSPINITEEDLNEFFGWLGAYLYRLKTISALKEDTKLWDIPYYAYDELEEYVRDFD